MVIIEAPSNIGLKTPASNVVPGVDKLPAWFKKHGLYQRFPPTTQVVTVAAPAYTGQLDEETGVRQANDLVTYSQQLALAVAQAVDQQQFAFVIGGDCSILPGCLLGLPSSKPFGLFFLDGHTDFTWPGLSQTGGAAGMDLALATGYGPAKLTNINSRRPYVAENRVFCVGNRYVDEAYVAAIESSTINYWNLASLRQSGINQCVAQFLQLIENNQLAGFWIHLDVDVLDDTLMPAVDSRQSGGLSYAELVQLVTSLLVSGKAIGFDITILDPNLDTSGIHTQQFIDELQPIWHQLSLQS